MQGHTALKSVAKGVDNARKAVCKKHKINIDMQANHTNFYWLGVKEYRSAPKNFAATKLSMTVAASASELALGTQWKKKRHQEFVAGVFSSASSLSQPSLTLASPAAADGRPAKELKTALTLVRIGADGSGGSAEGEGKAGTRAEVYYTLNFTSIPDGKREWSCVLALLSAPSAQSV